MESNLCRVKSYSICESFLREKNRKNIQSVDWAYGHKENMATSQSKQRGDLASIPVRYSLRVWMYHLFTCDLHLQKKELRNRLLSSSSVWQSWVACCIL